MERALWGPSGLRRYIPPGLISSGTRHSGRAVERTACSPSRPPSASRPAGQGLNSGFTAGRGLLERCSHAGETYVLSHVGAGGGGAGDRMPVGNGLWRVCCGGPDLRRVRAGPLRGGPVSRGNRMRGLLWAGGGPGWGRLVGGLVLARPSAVAQVGPAVGVLGLSGGRGAGGRLRSSGSAGRVGVPGPPGALRGGRSRSPGSWPGAAPSVPVRSRVLAEGVCGARGPGGAPGSCRRVWPVCGSCFRALSPGLARLRILFSGSVAEAGPWRGPASGLSAWGLSLGRVPGGGTCEAGGGWWVVVRGSLVRPGRARALCPLVAGGSGWLRHGYCPLPRPARVQLHARGTGKGGRGLGRLAEAAADFIGGVGIPAGAGDGGPRGPCLSGVRGPGRVRRLSVSVLAVCLLPSVWGRLSVCDRFSL